MAKKPTRPPAIRRDRSYRRPGPGSAPRTDPDPLPERQQEQLDWTNACNAATDADNALVQAEDSFQYVVQAAQDAEAAADWAVRAAVQAEENAAWVLADAQQMVAAARARVEAARGLARAGQTVATEAQEGEWQAETADPDVGPPLSPAFQAARRAMAAVSYRQSGRRDH
jgi:hypothetical protein